MDDRIISVRYFLDSLDWGSVKPFRGIVLHHSATPDNRSFSWPAIRRYHVETNGWKDIGYHLGVENVGNETWTLRGRPLTEFGAHALNYNGGDHACIGICVVGSYDATPPTMESWGATVDLVVELKKQFLERRGVHLFVMGHRETYAPGPPLKTCPGSAFDLQRFRKDVF